MYSDNLTQKVAQAAAKIMDEELKGKQHKIDANKNGKVDAEDFKLLKAKKEVKEESEQIDELSKKTLGSYVNKSAKDAVDRTAQEVETGEIDKLADKRMSGIKLATKKLAKRKDGHQNIDVHCHYFNPVVGKKASVLNPLEKDLLYIYANKLTRATNAKQMRDRAPMLSDVSVRLQDMDRMGIDI